MPNFFICLSIVYFFSRAIRRIVAHCVVVVKELVYSAYGLSILQDGTLESLKYMWRCRLRKTPVAHTYAV
jgi:hypothetical protein